jgi:hypothetical protein
VGRAGVLRRLPARHDGAVWFAREFSNSRFVRVSVVPRGLLFPILLALGASACERAKPVETDFTARVRFDGSQAVYLNQPLVVVFSEPVDPLTVSLETLRVVDASRHVVPGQQLDVGSQVVTVRFRPPISPALGDGSLAPDRPYTLEVVGYPELHSVRSRFGRVLTHSFIMPFRTVGVSGRAEYPRPLLPDDPGLGLAFVRRPEFALSTGKMRLQFSCPPYPVSVLPSSFRVYRGWQGAVVTVPIEQAMVVPSTDAPLGTVVELRLTAEPPLSIADRGRLWIGLTEGAPGLVDYAGLPATGERLLEVQVEPDSIRSVASVLASARPHFESPDPSQITFEVRDRGRMTPCARIVGGSGRLGFVRPTSSVPFSVQEPVLELSGLEIPAGVRLTLRGPQSPVLIRVSGSVRIAGELVLETPRGAVVGSDSGAWVPEGELAGLAGCVIVAAGDIEVAGRIEHAEEGLPMGPPLALVAGGRITLTGRTPPGLVYACEGDVVGHAQAASRRRVRLQRGWAGLGLTQAAARTDWLPIPAWATGEVLTKMLDVEGLIDVYTQIAPAHPLDPTRPDPQPESWSQPRPANESLVDVAGRFVRFELRAAVQPAPAPLPSLAGIRLVTR